MHQSQKSSRNRKTRLDKFMLPLSQLSKRNRVSKGHCEYQIYTKIPTNPKIKYKFLEFESTGKRYYITSVLEGADGGEDVDGDAEDGGDDGDEAEAAADDEERVGSRPHSGGGGGGGGGAVAGGRNLRIRHFWGTIELAVEN